MVNNQQSQSVTASKKSAGQKALDLVMNVLILFAALPTLYMLFWYYIAFSQVKADTFGYLTFSTFFLIALFGLSVLIYKNVIAKKFKSGNIGLLYFAVVLLVLDAIAFSLLLLSNIQLQF